MGFFPAQFTVHEGAGNRHRPRRCRFVHGPRETHARQGIAGQPVATTRRRGTDCLRRYRGRCRPRQRIVSTTAEKSNDEHQKGNTHQHSVEHAIHLHAAEGCGSICFAELMMSGLRVRGCAVLYVDGGEAGYTDCPTRSPGRKRRIRSRTRSVSLRATRYFLQRDSGRITGRDAPT